MNRRNYQMLNIIKRLFGKPEEPKVSVLLTVSPRTLRRTKVRLNELRTVAFKKAGFIK